MLVRRLGLIAAGLVFSLLLVGVLALGSSPLGAWAQAAAQQGGGAGMMGNGGMMNPSGTPGAANEHMNNGGMMGNQGCGGMMGDQRSFDPEQPYDLSFIDAMIPHHEMGVRMSEHMIAGSDRPELRDLAQRIIAAQTREIEQMKQWRSTWYPDAAAASTGMGGHMSGGMMGSGMIEGIMNGDQMSGGMMGGGHMSGGMMGGNADLDRMFLEMMIPHHQDAISMAEEALNKAEHPELQTLARQIIDGQQAEIAEMQDYLQRWYGDSGQ